MKDPRLVFTADVNKRLRIGHGRDCVVLMVDDGESLTMLEAAIFEPAEARALGRALRRQAQAAEEAAIRWAEEDRSGG